MDIVYQPVRSGDVLIVLHEEQYMSEDINAKLLHWHLTAALVNHMWDISGKM